MTELLYAIFSARGAIVATTACAIWIASRPHARAARRALLAVAISYLVASTYLVPSLVARALTSGYHEYVPAHTAGPAAIVVLGGGHDLIEGWSDRVGVLDDSSASRVLEAARVFRLLPDALVVSSGGVAPGARDRVPEGIVMRTMLLQLGVPDSHIVVETTSRDTHDEAVILAPMLRSRGIADVVLVTSDIHMRRSIGTFRAAGVQAVPAIAPDPRTQMQWSDWILPSGPGLDCSARVVHELVGLPYYWARGWWR